MESKGEDSNKETDVIVILKKIDEFETDQELEEYLESLRLSELLEIDFIQKCERIRIRNVILDSVKEKNQQVKEGGKKC